MAIVFVTNHDPNIDYRGLDKIANAVTHITSGRHFPGTYGRLLEDILQKLIHSQHTDYLCPTGDPLITAICSAVWLQLHPTLTLVILQGDNGITKFPVDRASIRIKAEGLRDLLQRR